MIGELLSWLFLALGAIAFAVVLHYFLKIKDISNKLLMVASNEFFDAANSLMRTPEDLPSSVLDALETMMSSMNNGQGARLLLGVLRETNAASEAQDSGESISHLRTDVSEMRQELQDLFGHTVVAWLNYVTNRHVLYQFAITAEVKKIAVRTQSVEVDAARTGMSLLPRLHATG